MTRTVLEPNETMAQRRASEEQALRDMRVLHTIRRNPGIPGKPAIASETGLTKSQVGAAIRRINDPDSGILPVAFGRVAVAGERVIGWHSVDRQPLHGLLTQEGEHIVASAVGLRRGLLRRIEKATGIPRAEPVVEQLEQLLAVKLEALSEPDRAAFTDLVAEQHAAAAPRAE
jgi:hypothetical protein